MNTQMNTRVHTQKKRTVSHETELRRYIYIIGIVIAILLISFTVSLVLSTKNAQAAANKQSITYTSVRIAEGESLWSIAETNCSDGDIISYIDEIKALNDLHTDDLKAGSYLIVPVQTYL